MDKGILNKISALNPTKSQKKIADFKAALELVLLWHRAPIKAIFVSIKLISSFYLNIMSVFKEDNKKEHTCSIQSCSYHIFLYSICVCLTTFSLTIFRYGLLIVSFCSFLNITLS